MPVPSEQALVSVPVPPETPKPDTVPAPAPDAGQPKSQPAVPRPKRHALTFGFYSSLYNL